jgi:5-methylcytosine-specific restriction endonuclease McrA
MDKKEAGKLGAKASLSKIEENKQKRMQAYYLNPLSCMSCKKVLSYADKRTKKKFCSSSCSASFNNSKRKPKRLFTCVVCKKETERKTSSESLFCSNVCFHKHRRDTKIQENTASSKTMKKFLIETKGYFCWGCGISSWMDKPITLELEHKDGDSTNNKEENLEILCPNCHSQTPTYKAKNKGKGRWQRKQRYAQGKSF